MAPTTRLAALDALENEELPGTAAPSAPPASEPISVQWLEEYDEWWQHQQAG